MDNRWNQLEAAARAFEQFGRSEEREKWSLEVTLLETKLEAALKRASEAETALERERENVMDLNQEVTRLSKFEREVARLSRRVIALNLSLLGGREGLYLACDQGDVKAASSFLEPMYNSSEDDATIREIQNEALRIAASGDFYDCCEMLIRRGANPSVADPRNGQNAIHRAVSAPGQSDAILLLFMRDESTRNHINDADASAATPLTLAVQLLRRDRMMCLVSFGADASRVSREDWKRMEDYQAQQVSQAASPRQKGASSSSGSSNSNSPKSSPSISSPDRQRGLFEVTNSFPRVAESLGKRDTVSPKLKETPEMSSERAGDLYRTGRYEEALILYASLEDVTCDWSKHNRATLFYNTARTAAKLGRHAEAADWCDKVLALFPESKDALIQRAESRMQVYDFARAAIDYESLAQISQDEEEEDWLKQASRARIFLHRTENHYAVLDVDPTCDSRTVHKAFLKKSLRWHPDKNRGSRDDQLRANFMMKALTEAKSVLEDPVRRMQYDSSRIRFATQAFVVSDTEEEEDDEEEDERYGKYQDSDDADGLSNFQEMDEDDNDVDAENDTANHRSFVYSETRQDTSQPSPMYRSPRAAADVFRPASSSATFAKSSAQTNSHRW